jgi:hypothetical protein
VDRSRHDDAEGLDTVASRRGLRRLFLAALAIPPLGVIGFGSYLVLFTNLPQILYAQSLRNIYFDCMEFVDEAYIYKMKPGACRQKNIEHDVVYSHDANGFRNSRSVPGYDVVVLGDSHGHGVGVRDQETFASVLEAQYQLTTLNLAIGSYATMRELEVLRRYGQRAKYVAIQYCSNDVSENEASVRLGNTEFRSEAETRWKNLLAVYARGKAMGYKKPVYDLGIMIRDHTYTSKSAWRKSAEARNMSHEALLFARIVAGYRQVLEGKRVVVFDVADYGMNSPAFTSAFGVELRGLTWLRFELIDTAKVLSVDDYFFLDNHINVLGHRKMAAAIADKIVQWERREPLIGRH